LWKESIKRGEMGEREGYLRSHPYEYRGEAVEDHNIFVNEIFLLKIKHLFHLHSTARLIII
jgi:hypothetical protein